MLVTINCLVPPVILQNSEQSVAARAAPVEGVDSPQPVTQGACDNSFCFLQTTLQLCVLWIIQHQRSLLQILHVNLDGTFHPYCLCRPPVQYCAHTHTHTLSRLSCACLFGMLLVQCAFHLWLLVQHALHLGLVGLHSTGGCYFLFFILLNCIVRSWGGRDVASGPQIISLFFAAQCWQVRLWLLVLHALHLRLLIRLTLHLWLLVGFALCL